MIFVITYFNYMYICIANRSKRLDPLKGDKGWREGSKGLRAITGVMFL